MLAWTKLSRYQQFVALAATVFIVACFSIGASARTPQEWLRISGPLVLLLAMELKPASFGGTAATPGWRGLPWVCKILTVVGLALTTVTLIFAR